MAEDDADAPCNNVTRGSFLHGSHFARSAADDRRDTSGNAADASNAAGKPAYAEQSDNMADGVVDPDSNGA
jgi:hypothetical protein